jgi:glycosyltransferase involved in cell wall biosynthesis
MIDVVHITAHLGGGVGRILSSLAIHSMKNINHVIITLENTENKHFEELCFENNIKVYCVTECNIMNILNNADIIQLDWWHHPLMSEFMVKYLSNIKCRLVIWSHISGVTYPHIPYKLINYADEFIFSTPYSLENKYWSKENLKEIYDNTHIVVSSGLETINYINKKKYDGFNIGYMGFLSYNKTHPEYVKYCEAICDINSIKFIIVGDELYGKELIKDVKDSVILRDKVRLEGYSTDVNKYFKVMDVFAYILNPEHYGTAENVLLEAMAAGVVPVVLNQGCEKYIVEDKVTGLVVNGINEFREAIKFLYDNPSEIKRLSQNASKCIISKYNINNTIKSINEIYNSLIKKQKKNHDAKKILGNTPYEWFKFCYIGNLNNIKGNAFAETKGSAKHYLKYFKYDEKLNNIVKINEINKVITSEWSVNK